MYKAKVYITVKLFHCQLNVFRTGSKDSQHHVDHRRKGGGIIYLASQT
jgi:hypothetical protein